jgi:endonuclease V-like protein UPF0215 family
MGLVEETMGKIMKNNIMMLQMPEKLRFAHYLCFVQDVKERFKQPVRVLRLQRYDGAKVRFTISFDFKEVDVW